MKTDQPTSKETYAHTQRLFWVAIRINQTCSKMLLPHLSPCCQLHSFHTSPTRNQSTSLPQYLIMHFRTHVSICLCALTLFWTSITLGLWYLAIIHSLFISSSGHSAASHEKLFSANGSSKPHSWTFCIVPDYFSGLIDNTDETIVL